MLASDLARRLLKLVYTYTLLDSFYTFLRGPLPKQIDVRIDMPTALYYGARWTAYAGLLWLIVVFINVLRDFRATILSEDGAKLLNPPEAY